MRKASRGTTAFRGMGFRKVNEVKKVMKDHLSHNQIYHGKNP